MKVAVIKPFRYGLRVFEHEEIGEVVTIEHPLTFDGRPIFDYYVKFPGYPPVGVHKSEVKEITT